jgi:hypothetical protein
MSNNDDHHPAEAPATNKPLGVRRLQWLAEITISRKYSPVTLSVAGALAWRFTDKKTAETKVKVDTLRTFLRCKERAVTSALAKLHNDGWLTVVAKSTRKGEATHRRLAFPGKRPEARANGASGEQHATSEPAWEWGRYEAHMVAWLNAETDPAAMRERWKSDEETRRRTAACAIDPESLHKLCESHLEHRLRGGKARAHTTDADDDDTPF